MAIIRRTLVTAPTLDPPLALTETDLAAHSRAAGQPSDQLVPYLYAAQEYIETVCNRKLLRQTWAAYLNAFPCKPEICLPYPPLAEVDHIKYTDSAGTQTTLSTTVYGVSTNGTPGRVVLKYNQQWPTVTLGTIDPIEIQFSCGYETAEDVPHTIRQAIRLLAGHYFANREAAILDGSGVNQIMIQAEIPMGVSSLIAPWRVW